MDIENHRITLRLTTFVQNLFWAFVGLYGLALAIYIGLYVVTGTRFWPVALLANFNQWILVPALVFLPLALLRRSLGLVLLFGVSGAFFLWTYAPLFMPHQLPSVDADTPLVTVMTHNVHNGAIRNERLLQEVHEADADIVGLVELRASQAAVLVEESGYPYHVVSHDGVKGIGLLSQYPILESEVFYLESRRQPHLSAVLDIGGVEVMVIVAHPPSPIAGFTGYRVDRASESDIRTLAAMAADNAPAILMGDFNISDQSDLYDVLPAAGLTDAFHAAGWGFGLTWHIHRVRGARFLPPLVRIDYIWTTPEWLPVRSWVGDHAGSDHRPVLAVLAPLNNSSTEG